jgi:hypothetical protein
MVLREGDLTGDTIVLLGSFNTAILQPAWLEAQGLFEGRSIEVRQHINTPPVVILNLGWFVVQVLESQAVFSTTDESPTPGPLRDFVVALFRILEHTPISALGMNHALHFVLSEDGWNRLAERLARGDEFANALPGARLTSIAWRLPRDDGLEGNVNLKLEPSQRLSNGGWAEWNSHVVLSTPEQASNAGPAVEVLEARWDDDRRQAMESFQFLRTLA